MWVKKAGSVPLSLLLIPPECRRVGMGDGWVIMGCRQLGFRTPTAGGLLIPWLSQEHPAMGGKANFERVHGMDSTTLQQNIVAEKKRHSPSEVGMLGSSWFGTVGYGNKWT